VIDGVLGSEQFGELQQEPAGLGVDLDVAGKVGIGVFRFQLFDDGLDLLAFRLDLRKLFGLGLDWRRSPPSAASSASGTGGRLGLRWGLLGKRGVERQSEQGCGERNQSLHL